MAYKIPLSKIVPKTVAAGPVSQTKAPTKKAAVKKEDKKKRKAPQYKSDLNPFTDPATTKTRNPFQKRITA